MKYIFFVFILTTQLGISQIMIESKFNNYKVLNNNYIEIEITFKNKTDSVYLIYLQNWRYIKTDSTGYTFGWPNKIILGNRVWLQIKNIVPNLRLAEDNSVGRIYDQCIKAIEPGSEFKIMLCSLDENTIFECNNDKNVLYFYYSLAVLSLKQYKNFKKEYSALLYESGILIIPMIFDNNTTTFNIMDKIKIKNNKTELSQIDKNYIQNLFHFRYIQLNNN